MGLLVVVAVSGSSAVSSGSVDGYRLTEHFTPRVEYRFEGYTEPYFNQDVMEPYMVQVDASASTAVFLGARQPGYAAHLLYLGLSYDL